MINADMHKQVRVGVIDVGSNSVRLVVYNALKRVPVPLFNEKVLCGLALGLEKTGKLNPEGVMLAHQTLARFIRLAAALEVKSLHVLATAAVRDAVDGQAFVTECEQRYNIRIRIFSGVEEARYATLGIMAAFPGAFGLIGDLGGGSLELARIGDDKVEAACSFPLGLLRLLAAAEGDKKKAASLIDSYIKDLPLFQEVKGKSFYAVGGGFRNLAKIYIALTHYPLRILHHYTVPTSSFLSVLKNITQIPLTRLEALSGISGRRAETLPYTALVMERIIALMQPSRIVFSAYGIREGFLFGQLSAEEQAEDPLIASCITMIRQIDEPPAYGYELHQWMAPLFADETQETSHLRLGACILSGLARYEHTEYRAEIAFRRFLDSFVIGVSHRARLFIATALFHRYKSAADDTILSAALLLLEDEALKTARIIGLAMRLGHNISAGMPGVLPATSLTIQHDTLVLGFQEGSGLLMGEAVQKRLDKLAQVMGLKVEVRG